MPLNANLLLTITFLMVWSSSVNSAPCDDGVEDYSPCSCNLGLVNGVNYVDITCNQVTPAQVTQVFSQIKRQEFSSLNWTVLPVINEDGQEIVDIPTNFFFGDKRFNNTMSIWLEKSFILTIHPEAIRSSSNYLQYLTIVKGDWTKQSNYSFLTDFNRLGSFRILGGVNIPGFNTLPPYLPALWRLEMSSSTGLEERTIIDSSTASSLSLPMLREFYLQNNQLSDATVEGIFQALLPASRDSMWFLVLENNRLTRIPDSLPEKFPTLGVLRMTNNGVTELKNGSLTFPKTTIAPFLFLGDNLIDVIEPGTFDNGHYYDSLVNLTNNRLTSFEEEVYFPVLTEMYESGSNNGQVNVSLNAIDCSGCGLSWLIRDNRRLMFRIDNGATCSNGTNFNDLNPEGYRECPAAASIIANTINH